MNRAAHEFHTRRNLGQGPLRAFLAALPYGWPKPLLAPVVAGEKIVLFLAWRDGLAANRALDKYDAMSPRDRRRLARSMRRHQPCASYFFDCGCRCCRTHDKLKELLR